MPKQNTTEQAPKARRTAVDYAKEAAEPFDAARSTDERERPVSVTSADEAKARAALRQYEVEEELPSGRRVVHRRDAASPSEAVWAVYGDGEPNDVVRVDEVRPA